MPRSESRKATAPMGDDLLPGDRRERFVAMLREGIPSSVAARSFDLTGTKIRGCRKRDPAFDAECAEAERESRIEYIERLSATARVRALDDDRRDTRMLEVELATHAPGYEHLRRDRMKVEGRIENAVVLPQLDGMSVERLLALRELLVEAGGAMIVDGEYVDAPVEEPPALPPAEIG